MNLVPSDSAVLRSVADRVTDIASQVAPVVADMERLMRDLHGVGLAAPQVGLPLRFFIYGQGKAHVAINPVILEASDYRMGSEGCLTFPGKFIAVERAHKITVRFAGLDGHEREKRITGFYAVIFQHELDHLNGKCIL